MNGRIKNIQTELWHRIMEDLKSSGFQELSHYEGFDAGIDYDRYDLVDPTLEETLVFEWDNWCEGEVTGDAHVLETIRARYSLSLVLAA